MQMTERFFKLFQSEYPHFGRGKGVHPCDNARTQVVIVRIVKSFSDGSLADQRRLQNHLKRQLPGSIQTFHNFRRMLRHFSKALVSIQIL